MALALGSEPMPNAIAQCVESDRTYFELGASTRPLPGATLAWMPRLTASPAAAVIHRVQPAVIANMGPAWVEQSEHALAAVGASFVRIYCDERGTAADHVLRNAGFTVRDELVFSGVPQGPPSNIQLRRIESEHDWERKLRFHFDAATYPDGHPHRPADWVAIERRKCAHGMHAYLAESNGEVVGAVGAIWFDGFARVKNIVVHPLHRRRSVARGMLLAVAGLSRQRAIAFHCMMAVRGGPGERLYRSAGLEEIGTQVEWSKPLRSAQS